MVGNERKRERANLFCFDIVFFGFDEKKKHVCTFALKNMDRNLQFVVHGCLHDGAILDDIWHATLLHLLS